MDTIQIHYNGHVPSGAGSGVTGEVGTCRLQFTFDALWDAYPERSAMLVSQFGTFAVPLDTEGGCTVPAQAVPEGDAFVRVSAFGIGSAANGAVLRFVGEPIRVTFYAGGATARILGEEELTAYDRLLARLAAAESSLGAATLAAEDSAQQAQEATFTANTAAGTANAAAAAASARFRTETAAVFEGSILFTGMAREGDTVLSGPDNGALVPVRGGHRLSVTAQIGTTQQDPVHLGVRLIQYDRACNALGDPVTLAGSGEVRLSPAAASVRFELSTETTGSALAPGWFVLTGRVTATDLDLASPVVSLDRDVVLPQLSDTGGLPEETAAAVERAAVRIRAQIAAAGADSDSFLYFTDPLWEQSTRLSPAILRALRAACGDLPVFCAGNWIGGTGLSAAEARSLLAEARRAFHGLGIVTAAGAGDRSVLTDGEVYAGLLEAQRGDVWEIAPGARLAAPGGRTVFALLDEGVPFASLVPALTAAADTLPAGSRIVVIAHGSAASSALFTWCDARTDVTAVFTGGGNTDAVSATPGGVPVIGMSSDGDAHAIDAVTLDWTSGVIRTIRVGSGTDRETAMRNDD